MTVLETKVKDEIRYDWQKDEVLQLFALPFSELIFNAATVHRKYFNPNEVQISTLLSIKTGSCPEDCSYCPQSAHYNTGLEKEPLLDVEHIESEAKKAKEAGASRFCMGAAWRQLHDRDVPQMEDIIQRVKAQGMEVCVTLGMATEPQLKSLKNVGLDYYNHNIDTSPEYYKEIISTRSFDDRLQTLENIRNSGLKTCCGGIIGMGESLQDRAEMLCVLANLPEHPGSVPINRLVPVSGTPLEHQQQIDNIDFVRTIAVARIMMPQSYVRLSAGRETMNDETQALCFLAGANSVFYGEKLLTTSNPGEHDDIKLFSRLGMDMMVEDKENVKKCSVA